MRNLLLGWILLLLALVLMLPSPAAATDVDGPNDCLRTPIDFGDAPLSAFDVSGRKLADLTRGRQEAGEHSITWNFTDRQGRTVAAGYYILKLRVGDRVLTQRGIRVR